MIRLLYYLPIERMAKVDENMAQAKKMLSGIVERCYELEEENKKLKEMSGKLGEMNGKLGEWGNNLEEENKKLKDEVKDLVERNIELDKKYMLVLTEKRKLEFELELKNLALKQIQEGSILI